MRAAALVVLLLAGCASTNEFGLTDAEAATCAKDGGCAVYTQTALRTLVNLALQAGALHGAASCRRSI